MEFVYVALGVALLLLAVGSFFLHPLTRSNSDSGCVDIPGYPPSSYDWRGSHDSDSDASDGANGGTGDDTGGDCSGGDGGGSSD